MSKKNVKSYRVYNEDFKELCTFFETEKSQKIIEKLLMLIKQYPRQVKILLNRANKEFENERSNDTRK